MAGSHDWAEDAVNVFAAIRPFAEFIEAPALEALGDEVGTLTFSLRFLDNSTLDFVVTADFASGHPTYTTYSIHYQDQHRLCIFRYDNAPHHPELSPFPQHKHVGSEEHAIDGALPSIRKIVREISEALPRSLEPRR